MPESPKEETPKKSGASQAIPNNILKALQTSSTATPKNKADFVIHISDDGQKFNTTERIVNGTCSYFLLFLTFTCLYWDLGPHVIVNISVCVDVPPPATTVPQMEEFFSKSKPGFPDLDFLKSHFAREGLLTEEQAALIIKKGTEILRKEPTVLDVEAPATGKTLF